MKRHRVFSIDFDSTVNLLKIEVGPEMSEDVAKQIEANKSAILEDLKKKFGEFSFEQKLANLMDLDDKPLSVLAFHNKFFHQARVAFVMGAYYPALTAACALGERILNHLIRLLREDFKATEEYKEVYRKDSFDHWDLPIKTLESWGVLLPEVTASFRKLRNMRNAAIHFRPEVDVNDRELALEAMLVVRSIIKSQFSGFGAEPWFIPGTPGEIYIKKEWESKPFIAKVFLPNCGRVGPDHKVESVIPWKIRDRDDYDDIEISDEEFVRLRAEGVKKSFGVGE